MSTTIWAFLALVAACLMALTSWLKARTRRKTIYDYVWRMHAQSTEYLTSSKDENMSDDLREIHHAKAIECNRIAKEIDLLALDGEVAQEMWQLRAADEYKRKDRTNVPRMTR